MNNIIKPIEIESFDLIVSTSTTLFSKLIQICQYISNGISKNYSHVGIIIKGNIFPKNTIFGCYEINPNEIYILESVMFTKNEAPNIFGKYFDGVQLRKFDIVSDSYKKEIGKSITKFGIAKLNKNSRKHVNNILDTNMKKKLVQKIDSMIGLSYNFNLIDQIFVPFHNFTFIKFLKFTSDFFKNYYYPQNKTMLCPEVVAEILIELKLLKPNIHLNYILPEDFLPKDDNTTCDADKEINLIYDNPVILV